MNIDWSNIVLSETLYWFPDGNGGKTFGRICSVPRKISTTTNESSLTVFSPVGRNEVLFKTSAGEYIFVASGSLVTAEPDMLLVTEITALLNKHSRENVSNTPDFVLAEVMVAALRSFEAAKNKSKAWENS